MYFITNSENYIVAASKDFLEKSGTRELCSIASALRDGTIRLDSENNLFKAHNFEEEMRYESSKLFSSFGTLTLYSLSNYINKEQEIDESINYLKQIKEGVVKTDDHEFSIPTINTIHKNRVTAADLEEEPKEQEQEKEIESPITETLKIETTDEESKESLKEQSDSYETVKLFSNTHDEESDLSETKESIKLSDYASSDSKDASDEVQIKVEEDRTEKIDLEEKPHEEENKFVIDDSNEETDHEVFKIKPLDEQQLVIEDEDIDKITLKKEQDEHIDLPESTKVVEIPTTSQEPAVKKESGLDRLKEKLFPWGSKAGDNIELEEKEVLTTASDLAEKFEEKESAKEESIALFKETQDKKEAIEESLALTQEQKEHSIEDLEIKEAIDEAIEENTLEARELHELKQMHEEKLATIIPTVTEETIEIKEESDTLSTTTPSHNIYYKLIKVQVDGIDLEKNAKSLSIDLDSYKMLLSNYLEELENYQEDLENRSSSTISMLEDASELLALQPVTKKLKELAQSDKSDNSALRDLTLLASLLKEKIEDKTATKTETLEPAVTVVSKEKDDSLETEEIIDITSSQSLLENIKAQKVAFDPKKAADDLNLPTALILEFVDDFIVQAKEHLSQMVKAYKDKDLKTLQTTAHMLKGAASNLRIDSVSQTLFTLQKLQSVDKAEELLKEFVAKLKGLESEVKNYESAIDEN